MAKHRARRAARRWLPVAALIMVIGVVSAVIVLRAGGRDTGAPSPVASSGPCTVLRVVAASSFRPVLDTVRSDLATGPACLDLQVTPADGRAAAGIAAQGNADVWIPDDPAWLDSPGVPALADGAGAGTVLATSPIYLVGEPDTVERLRAAGGSWLALAKLVDAGRTRLAVRDPAGSGDGLVAAAAVAESVWTESGMDASALWLSRALARTRTVTGAKPALPAAGEVGLVPEYALLSDPPQGRPLAALAGNDVSALLRWTWQPTAAGVGDPARATALERLRAVLTGPDGAAARAAAFLRDAQAVTAPPVPAAASGLVQARLAGPMEVLGKHHVDHVFATWYPADRRTDVLIVVDVSGSMADPAPGSTTRLIDLVRRGVRSAAGLLPDDSRMGLWEFGVRLDGPRDHRQLLGAEALTAAHRRALAKAVDGLDARRTGTGLHDTILAAYRSAVQNHRPGVLNQVMVFTDGRNEDDPGGLSAGRLSRALRAARDDKRPVQLSVVSFGDPGTAAALQKAVKPVDGYVDPVATPDEVDAVFIHLAAGGLHH